MSEFEKYQNIYEEGKKILHDEDDDYEELSNGLVGSKIIEDEQESYDYYSDLNGKDNKDTKEPINEDDLVPKYIEENPIKYPDLEYEELEEDEPEELVVDNNDLPIFPNGPLKSQIDAWKKKYKDSNFHVIDVADNFFVFRTLNRFEYKQISGYDLSMLAREELICVTCTLWPQNYNHKAISKSMAGVTSTYCQAIMENSGFTKNYSISKL